MCIRDRDYTAIWVVGIASDGNWYVVDFLRDRLAFQERISKVFELARKYGISLKEVLYERYGMQVDIDAIKQRQNDESYHFKITEVAGRASKEDRIRRLAPLFFDNKIYLPRRHDYADEEGLAKDMVREFIHKEYKTFPVSMHDDMMDALSRLCDISRPINPSGSSAVHLPKTITRRPKK